MPNVNDHIEKRKLLLLAYKQTFNTESGKQVLDDLKQRFFFDASPFSPESGVMAYQVGQHDVIKLIQAQLDRNPADLDTLREQAQTGGDDV